MMQTPKASPPQSDTSHSPVQAIMGCQTTPSILQGFGIRGFEETPKSPDGADPRNNYASVLVPQAHTMGTALKTPVRNTDGEYLGSQCGLKASKETGYRNPLRTTATDVGVRQSSKDEKPVLAGSKEYQGVRA